MSLTVAQSDVGLGLKYSHTDTPAIMSISTPAAAAVTTVRLVATGHHLPDFRAVAEPVLFTPRLAAGNCETVGRSGRCRAAKPRDRAAIVLSTDAIQLKHAGGQRLTAPWRGQKYALTLWWQVQDSNL